MGMGCEPVPAPVRGIVIPRNNTAFLRELTAARVAAWASAGASERVQSWLRDGYQLQWRRMPPRPFHLGRPCEASTAEERAFLMAEVQRCFDTGALEQATSSSFVSPAFLSPKPNKPGSWRLVVDLRHLNEHLVPLTCRMETLKRLGGGLAQRGDWMVSLDLADGFHSVAIHPDHRKYLTFAVEGVGLVQCAALPFGLSQSPYVFTKTMRILVRALRAPLAPLPAAVATPGCSQPPRAPLAAPSSSAGAILPRSPPRTPTQVAPAARVSFYTPPHRRAPLFSSTAPTAAATASAAASAASCAPPSPPQPLPPLLYTPPHRRATSPLTLSSLIPRFGGIMRHGIRCLPYMDDFLGMFRSRAEALEGRAYVEAVLDLFGLSRNPKKGEWEPTQTLVHLGLGVDTVRGLFFVPPERQAKLQRAAREILGVSAGSCSLIGKRRLAGFVGLAQSVSLAVPPARHHLRSLHDCVASQPGWGGHVRLTDAARSDLLFWVHLPERWASRAIWRSPTTVAINADASKLAWGATLRSGDALVLARGFWTPAERRHHITLLEAQAVSYALESFSRPHHRDLLAGTEVSLGGDNQAVVQMLHTWTSRSPDLMRVLRSIWYQLDCLDARLQPFWMSTLDNGEADFLSRLRDPGDWRLSQVVFRRLDVAFGPHTVDRFASCLNTHLPRYNSAWADQRSAGVNAFAQPSSDWLASNNFCCPPWDLLPRLAQLLVETGAPATVVAPCWPAQAWYQLLQERSCEVLHLPASPSLLLPGRQTLSGSAGRLGWPLTVFRLPARLSAFSMRA